MQSSKKVQDKMHYAVHGHTAAELIVDRASTEREHMGLTTWSKTPDENILKSNVSVAKTYLREKEVLPDAGKVTTEFAKQFAESEFEKYRVIQDRLFSSDFDKF